MQITIELILTEIIIAGVLFPVISEKSNAHIIFQAITFLPTALNLVILAESYLHNNLKLIPLMLQLIMLRKELQLLFPIEDTTNIQMRRAIKLTCIGILVMLQVVIGTFTNQPDWAKRVNPFVHFLIIFSFSIIGNADFEAFNFEDFMYCLMCFSMVISYIRSAFATFLKVVEQSIAKELNSHRRITAMFNSLQEGIVIVQQDSQPELKPPKIIFAN